MRDSICILLVEDNPGDARLITEILAEARNSVFQLICVDCLEECLKRSGDNSIDVVLLDLSLPDSSGFETLSTVADHMPDIPIVVLTGLNDEEMALRAVRKGAQDYLIKGQVEIDLLERVIQHSIERKRVHKVLQDLNATLEQRVADRTKELTAAYEALASANEELRKLDRMKSTFIDLTSHELKTPLTVLSGFLSLIKIKMLDDNPEMFQMMESAMRSSQYLENIVARTLRIIDLGSYERDFNRQSISMHDLVQHVIADLSPFIDIRQQYIQVNVPDDLPMVSVDVDKMRDVITNLLINAIKFTPDGGTIELSACLEESKCVRINIIDSGIGISEEDKPHIFDEFFTSFDIIHHSSGVYEFEKRGIGLGLALVKKFVEMHGGNVGLDSAPGQGSNFFFTIPAGIEETASVSN